MLHAPRSLLRPIRLATLALAGSALVPFAAAQGSLTPPGAPAPTMKSLSELDATLATINAKVDRRTPVSAATTPGDATNSFIISQPGSYFLSANVSGEAGKVGISIQAPNVTLDLNGFTLIAGASTSNCIVTSGGTLNQVVVRNGIIFGPWAIGIRLTATNSAILDVRSSGTSDEGIRVLGSGGVIERCQVNLAGGHGIAAATDQSVVRDCTVTGVSRASTTTLFGIIGSTITNCTVANIMNTDAGGAGVVYGLFGTTISNCRVANVTCASGTVYLISGTVIDHCAVTNSAVTTPAALFGIAGREVSHCHVYWLVPVAPSVVCIGINAPSVSSCVVERIISSTPGIFGIRSGTTDSSGETGVFVHNSVSSINGAGIYSAGHCLMESNRVSNCSTNGIQVSSGVVRANYTHNNGTGIALTLGSATANTSVNDSTAFTFAAGVRAGPIVVGGGAGGFDATANLDL